MDFLKNLFVKVLPVNSIIKFIIKQFLSSYLIIKENDLEEKQQENSDLKNLININDLELNVSNINHEHLLHSPIKLLKGVLGKFVLDITNDNKIIISIEDVSIDLMPLFNYYKKYQETIFNMEKTKDEVQKESEQENKKIEGGEKNNASAPEVKNKNVGMLNMANNLLKNLEINIKNVSIKLFTYEITEKIVENPVFSLFIMNINIYKDPKSIKNESIIDPNNNQPFEEIFLNNLIIDIDKLCLKNDQNLNRKDNKEFKEIKNFCDNKNLTKQQEERILSFFMAYNTIFAMNYKKGPCLSIKLNTKPKKQKYKEKIKEIDTDIEVEKEIIKEKIVEDMIIEIDIFEAESIITPHQLFNIQILYQISNFIFTLNKNTPGQENNQPEEKKKFYKNKKINLEPENSSSSSGIFNKNNENNNSNLKISIMPMEVKNEDNENKKKEKSKTDILGHEIDEFNIFMNAKRIILVLLENNNNESIPKLFSFLMEDEIEKKKKSSKNEINSTIFNFNKSNESFENYYCYFEDNLLFLKIENIQSVNNSINANVKISSVIAEYIKPERLERNNNGKSLLNNTNKSNKEDLLQASVYESMTEFDDFKEEGEDNEDIFESAIEKTDVLLMENYTKYINKYIAGEYLSSKFEILIINDIIFDMAKNNLDIKEILVNLNYIIVLLFIKLFSQIKYFIDISNPLFTSDDIIIMPEEIKENLNVNLEKKINDSELQLFKNLSKTYKSNSGDDNKDDNNGENEQDYSLNESIDYSEEEKKKKNGMKININYISIKVYNVSKNIQRFDTNIYYYKLFLELIYPNIENKLNKNKYESIEQQSFKDLVSKDYIEVILNGMNMIYYSISNTSKINIVFEGILLKYWNYILIQYNNINKKNNLDDNPNLILTMPGNDMIVDFSEKIKINLEKNILDDLLDFTNTFLYGLSMYQIFDQYCRDLYSNKLLNLFDSFGLKNHFIAIKKIDDKENQIINDNQNNSKIDKNLEEIQNIKKQLNNKRTISIGGRIISCVININKNGTFEEKEGNLIKIKMVNIGVNLEMFSDDNSDNPNKEPIYNILSISINNIYFLIKEHPLPKEGKPKYYNLFSKNKTQIFESTDYFVMNFKFRNVKKIQDDIIIEEENEDSSDNEEKENKKENEKEKEKENKDDNSKKKNKFEINNSKISLGKNTKDYIAFLLNNQVKLDNMEMVVDIKLSEIIFDSFYDKLNMLSSTLGDFYIDFTNTKKIEENLDGTYLLPSDLIPLCEDRLMFIKCNFYINHLLIDIFLKEDKDQANWMRLLLLIEKFKFTFNEDGILLLLENNYVYIMKDFNYIYSIKKDNKNDFFIEDKINDIHKEDSYLKRLGYAELFYNDKIKVEKLEKELNVNLGNLNLFFCKDSFDFIMEFQAVFTENYVDKIMNIFSQDSLSSEDSNEEMEKEEINIRNKREKLENNKENKKGNIKEENKKNEFMNDFEVVDDVFFMDDLNKNKEKKKNDLLGSKYLKKNYNGLNTIPEENSSNKRKNKKGNSKNDFKDEFTVIETQSSLQRKILREAKEEDCIKYFLKLNSLRLYLFSGSDFSFQDDNQKDIDLNSNKNDEINNIENEENEPNFMDIDNNYLVKLTFKNNKVNQKVLTINKRKKNEERDYSNYILINIIDLSFNIIDFYFFDFIIGNFFIDDNFEKSLYQKIISKQDYTNEVSKFLICKMEMNKNKGMNKDREITSLRINLSLPSLDIFLDQLPLTFIIKLLLSQNYDNDENKKDNEKDLKKKDDDEFENISDNNSKDENQNSNKDKGQKNDIDALERINSKDSWNDEDIENYADSLIYINSLSIDSFTINFHYNSHKIAFKKLFKNKDRDWIEFLTGLADVKDLNLKFKTFKKNTQTQLADIISELITFWKDDILDNQITDSVLRGFSITRPFFKLYDGVKDLVRQPYISFKKNEGIKRGLKKGMKNFLFSFSSQGLFFGEKIFRGMKIVVYRKTKLSLKKKSLYKTWVYKINKKQHDYEAHYFK